MSPLWLALVAVQSLHAPADLLALRHDRLEQAAD
jgi:hypothetical protein